MPKIITAREKIDQLLTRGVEEIIDKKSLKSKLLSNKKLTVKLGIDPTSPNLHLGRSVPLLKLRDFQELGHQVVFIIGDFTGIIGDTSDKESERPMLTEVEVGRNMKDYSRQIGKLLDLKKCQVVYNSKWLKKLGYAEVGNQANIFSLNEFISRENIKKRLDQGKRISLREVLYPLMQGYDSMAVKADVEIGGTDQRFNLLAGRKIQRFYGQAPQDVIMGPLVAGLDGRKMSSSWGNTINFVDQPQEMFGKIMSVADNLIITYFELLTRADKQRIEEYQGLLQAGENPKNIKIELAKEIVALYYDPIQAQLAAEEFTRVFSKKEKPANIPVIKPRSDKVDLAQLLVDSKMASSKSEARRKIIEGAVRVNNQKIIDWKKEIQLKKDDLIQVGKRKFVKIS